MWINRALPTSATSNEVEEEEEEDGLDLKVAKDDITATCIREACIRKNISHLKRPTSNDDDDDDDDKGTEDDD